jgi:hypothetical protein
LSQVREWGAVPRSLPHDIADQLLLPLHLRKDGVDLKLFSILSTLGTAVDLTLQELTIESFFPADVATETQLAELRARF